MVYEDVAVYRSQWVGRALWLIAASLAVALLLIRSHGLGSRAKLGIGVNKPNAARAFRIPAVKNSVLYSLDAVSWSDHPAIPVAVRHVITVAAGSTITITGWAFDRSTNAAFEAIGARVDNHPEIFSANMQLSRPDVAAAVGSANAARAGFELTVATKALHVGRHSIVIHALGPNGRTSTVVGDSIAFNILPDAATMQHTDSLDGINGIGVNDASSIVSPIVVQRSYHKLTISGWGFITKGQRLANNAVILVDGNTMASATYGVSRPDVAGAFHDVRVTRCGFIGTLSMDSLPPGIHEIKVMLGSNDGSTIESASALRIDLH